MFATLTRDLYVFFPQLYEKARRPIGYSWFKEEFITPFLFIKYTVHLVNCINSAYLRVGSRNLRAALSPKGGMWVCLNPENSGLKMIRDVEDQLLDLDASPKAAS